ncbi:hypothetical protein H9638_11300 [Arthrobacter sp. Sa2BUA2]|uniref:Uncharacterized protein n=2 Tax=Arthrobacter pullicola TaxID=2762224 RepID=A0ABR8YJH5_9MICC|nr:hypothetical protein [Arthrobacter pullicola]
MAMQGIGAFFFLLYILGIVALFVLLVWALVLSIIFLRLRIAELRRLRPATAKEGSDNAGGASGL